MVAKIQRPVVTDRRYSYCQQWRPKFVANTQPLFASIRPPSNNFGPGGLQTVAHWLRFPNPSN
jgi:hypothetical protein